VVFGFEMELIAFVNIFITILHVKVNLSVRYV